MIIIEFWNGHTSKKKKYIQYGTRVTTGHNPCLWSTIECENKPWRSTYIKAVEYVEQWKNKEINDTELLHCLRYTAYGNDERTYDNTDVIWPGNLTVNHLPMLTYKNNDEEFTLYFYNDSDNVLDNWYVKQENEIKFYWTEDINK